MKQGQYKGAGQAHGDRSMMAFGRGRRQVAGTGDRDSDRVQGQGDMVQGQGQDERIG